jgi:hypothetical protein
VESPIGLKSLSLGWYEAVYILGIETAIKLEQNQCCEAAQVPTRLVSVSVWYCLRSYQSGRIISTSIDTFVDTRWCRPAFQASSYLSNTGQMFKQTNKRSDNKKRSVERNKLMAHSNT